MNKEEKSYIDEYNVFWKSIVENEDGTLNKDQVMRELSDYSMVLDNCALAYSTMTNQKVSKQNTKFFEVENIFKSEFISMEYYDELQRELEQKNNIIEEIKNKNKKLVSIIKTLEKEFDLIPSEYVKELERGDSNE